MSKFSIIALTVLAHHHTLLSHVNVLQDLFFLFFTVSFLLTPYSSRFFILT